MPLSISDGGYVHGAEYDNIFRTVNRRGLESGCEVTESSPQAMSVEVATGTLVYDGNDVSVSQQTVTIAAADSEDRFDLVTLDSAGTAAVVQGTPAPDNQTPPSASDLPDGEVLLAVVTVPANASAITNSDIRDSRLLNSLGKLVPEPFYGNPRLPTLSEVGTLSEDTVKNAVDAHFSQSVWTKNIQLEFSDSHGQTTTSACAGFVSTLLGNIVAVPFDSDDVVLIEPETGVTSTPPSSAHAKGDSAFIGGLLLPDGRILLIPSDSTEIGLYQERTTTYSDGPTHGEGANAFSGGTLLPDGRALLAPFDSNNIGLFDPSTDSYTSGPTHGEGADAFSGAQLLIDGRVLLVPNDSDNLGLFDPSTDSYTSGPSHGQGDLAFNGGVLLPDGRVVLIPSSATSFGLFDPSDDSFTTGASRPHQCSGGLLLPDGRVFAAPAEANEGPLFYDVETGTVEQYGSLGVTDGQSLNAALAPNGLVIFGDRTGNEFLLMGFPAKSPDPIAAATHPFWNKF